MKRLLIMIATGIAMAALLGCSGDAADAPAARLAGFLDAMETLVAEYGADVDSVSTEITRTEDAWYDRTVFELARAGETPLPPSAFITSGVILKSWIDAIRVWDACVGFDAYPGTIRADSDDAVSADPACADDFRIVVRPMSGGVRIHHSTRYAAIILYLERTADDRLLIRGATYDPDERPVQDGKYAFLRYEEGVGLRSVTRGTSSLGLVQCDLVTGDCLFLYRNGDWSSRAWYHADGGVMITSETQVETSNLFQFYEGGRVVLAVLRRTEASEEVVSVEADLLSAAGWNRIRLPRPGEVGIIQAGVYDDDRLVLEQKCDYVSCVGFQYTLQSSELKLMSFLHERDLAQSDFDLSAFGLSLADERFTLAFYEEEREAFSALLAASVEWDELIEMAEGKRTYPSFVTRSMFW